MDERPLSERLEERCSDPAHPMTYEQASVAMGQPANAVSRWVRLDVIPGPDKWPAIAEFLGISQFEVSGESGLDQIERTRRRKLR